MPYSLLFLDIFWHQIQSSTPARRAYDDGKKQAEVMEWMGFLMLHVFFSASLMSDSYLEKVMILLWGGKKLQGSNSKQLGSLAKKKLKTSKRRQREEEEGREKVERLHAILYSVCRLPFPTKSNVLSVWECNYFLVIHPLSKAISRVFPNTLPEWCEFYTCYASLVVQIVCWLQKCWNINNTRQTYYVSTFSPCFRLTANKISKTGHYG